MFDDEPEYTSVFNGYQLFGQIKAAVGVNRSGDNYVTDILRKEGAKYVINNLSVPKLKKILDSETWALKSNNFFHT